jgi:hypothetical protein
VTARARQTKLVDEIAVLASAKSDRQPGISRIERLISQTRSLTVCAHAKSLNVIVYRATIGSDISDI